MKNIFEGKTMLVTGGCGSIGTEIVKQLLKFNPKVVRVFDNNEEGHFRLNQKLNLKDSEKIRNLVGNITDKDRVRRAMEDVDIVFHAAALKHVPFCEYNPFEAVRTNVIGTENLVDAAIEERVDTFVAISTDKAVNPINTMGATKLLAEKIVTNAPIGKSYVKFCCVRFGNVLNSSGSVIPIFREQIKRGNVLTITSKKMARFFMSMPEAVELVLKASTLTEGGEVFILKMDALRIIDLAEVLVDELAPKYGKNPKLFEYRLMGVRPGEKIYEYLMTSEEAEYVTEHEDMFVLQNSLLSKHCKNNKPIEQNGNIKCIDYHSGNVSPISKEEIKKRLYEKKIL